MGLGSQAYFLGRYDMAIMYFTKALDSHTPVSKVYNRRSHSSSLLSWPWLVSQLGLGFPQIRPLPSALSNETPLPW